MAIKFSCPHCKKEFSVKDQLAGKRAACPACKKPLTIPAPASKPLDLEDFAASALADQPEAIAEPQEPVSIDFICPQCDEKISVNSELEGKQTPCPSCRRVIKVPLIEKQKKKDWRQVNTRLPSGAKENLQAPAPEGAWDVRSAAVSREALVEAAAIQKAKIKLTWRQVANRIILVTVLLGAAGLSALIVTNYRARNRESKAFAGALADLDAEGKFSPETVAEVHLAAADFSLVAGKAEEAKIHLQKARESAVKSARDYDRELLIIDILRSQVQLGGEKADVVKGTHIAWEKVQTEIRQTVTKLADREGRIEAMRQLTQSLLSRGQGPPGALAAQFPQEPAELLSVIGLEMLRGKTDPKMRESAATIATQALSKIPSPLTKEGDKPKSLAPATLITLLLALEKLELATSLATPPVEGKESTPAELAAYAAAFAYHGNIDEARKLSNWPGLLAIDRLDILLAMIEAAAVGASSSSAVPVIEEAISLLLGEANGNAHSPWFHYRLIKAGLEAGLGEKMLPVAKKITAPDLRGRAELLILRNSLAAGTAEADESRLQLVSKESSSYGAALEAVARHNARYGSAAKVLDTVSTTDEKLRPFLQIGVARGLQAKKK